MFRCLSHHGIFIDGVPHRGMCFVVLLSRHDIRYRQTLILLCFGIHHTLLTLIFIYLQERRRRSATDDA